MRFRSLLASSLVALTSLLPAGLPARGAESAATLKIPVILSLTGSGAFVGRDDQTSMQLLEKLVNAKGGVAGHPVEFDFLDDASNAQTGVQLADGVIASKVPIFIGPSLTQQCAAVVPLVRENGPADFCLSPGLNPAPNGWVWSSSVSLKDSAIALLKYFRERGLTKLAILSSTDATGQEIDRDYDYARSLPENRGIEFVAREHFNLSDVSVTAQMARIKAVNPQALLTWTVGPAFGTELHGISDVGLDVPVLASNGDMVHSQLQQYKAIMPKELLFTGVLVNGHARLAPGPIKTAQNVYLDAFAAAGVRPDFPHTLAWDPAQIVLLAYAKLGPNATSQQFRDFINTLHGFAGINGIYDFRDGTQHGIGQNALIMVRYDAGTDDFVPVSKRGGGLK
jgi:branched-chain amino acid transport system substrate-binding protein